MVLVCGHVFLVNRFSSNNFFNLFKFTMLLIIIELLGRMIRIGINIVNNLKTDVTFKYSSSSSFLTSQKFLLRLISKKNKDHVLIRNDKKLVNYK